MDVRMLHGPIVALIGWTLIVIVAGCVASVFAKESRRPVWIVCVGAILASFALFSWRVMTMAAMNEVRRSVIDRSVPNERADILKENARSVTPKGDEGKR